VTWQKILAQGFNSVADILNYLDLPLTLGNQQAEKQFRTRVPRGYVDRIDRRNPHDPLLRQVLAISEELEHKEGFTTDPLGESSTNAIPGLLHKYQGRVLLTLTGVCAINCRYCFRRHFPYEKNNPGRTGWNDALEYIRQQKNINEVILSGGDPLLASCEVIGDLLQGLSNIEHVRTVRFHTRIPIVLPERIDQTFLELLAATPLNKVMVLHSNHAQEINDHVKSACFAMQQKGCHLLNQSVLLKGVNDNARRLAALSERLFECGVLPYYLHLLDRVAGSGHFYIPDEEALAIYHELQAMVPGYLLPRLAREERGKRSKTLLV